MTSLPPTVDVHVHLAPSISGTAAWDRDVVADGELLVVDDHRVGPPALYDAGRLTAWMESRGVDQALVSMPPPFFRQRLDRRTATGWIHAANDGLRTRLDDHRCLATLAMLAYLPLEHPELAVSEHRRWVADPRVAGFVASAGGGSPALDDDRLVPLWQELDRAGAMLFLHPGASPDTRLDAYYLANLLGNPVETALAAAQLVFGELLVQYPGVRVVLAHCGGAVPAVVDRWQRGHDTARPGLRPTALAPAAAVRRLYVDAVGHDPRVIDLALEVFGPDRLVLGSDWPFPMGLDDPWSAVRHLPIDVRERVARVNSSVLLSGGKEDR